MRESEHRKNTFVDVDFIRRVFPNAHSRRFGYFGWAVTMPDETNTLASQATDQDLSNDILAVIRSGDGATTLSWGTCRPKPIKPLRAFTTGPSMEPFFRAIQTQS